MEEKDFHTLVVTQLEATSNLICTIATLGLIFFLCTTLISDASYKFFVFIYVFVRIIMRLRFNYFCVSAKDDFIQSIFDYVLALI